VSHLRTLRIVSLLATFAAAACAPAGDESPDQEGRAPEESPAPESTASAAPEMTLLPGNADEAPTLSFDPKTSWNVLAATVSPERALATRLGLPSRLAIGLGNDAMSYDFNQTHAYTLGPKFDLHYVYLSGLDWPKWNAPEGAYVTLVGQAAAWGDGNLWSLQNAQFMTQYWRNVRVMFQKLAALGVPAVVHAEPDLWGYAQKQYGDDPAKVKVLVKAYVPECKDYPDTIAGMGKCIVRLGRWLAPKVSVGLTASSFGAHDGTGQSDPVRIAQYLNKVGSIEADLLIVEMLDRDAGCFEAGVDPNCKRTGTFYWDETNTKKPNFRDHLSWAKTIRLHTGKPLLWWQVPLGVPSTKPGGTAGRYRDNRVRYVFSRPAEFAQAGGIGVVFGTGAKNQTSAVTDGGQLKNALTGYLKAPVALP
jgi:hypothetical protein